MVKGAGVALMVVLGASGLAAQRTILAVGAHAADMELTAGALLAHQKKLGDRVVLLHLSLGEGGNPKMAAADYAVQKRREALAAARALGAEVIFGPYTDGLVPDSEEAQGGGPAEVARRRLSAGRG
jgi:LmbE family N-acetylglucosaminyl deacetylase